MNENNNRVATLLMQVDEAAKALTRHEELTTKVKANVIALLDSLGLTHASTGASAVCKTGQVYDWIKIEDGEIFASSPSADFQPVPIDSLPAKSRLSVLAGAASTLSSLVEGL